MIKIQLVQGKNQKPKTPNTQESWVELWQPLCCYVQKKRKLIYDAIQSHKTTVLKHSSHTVTVRRHLSCFKTHWGIKKNTLAQPITQTSSSGLFVSSDSNATMANAISADRHVPASFTASLRESFILIFFLPLAWRRVKTK